MDAISIIYIAFFLTGIACFAILRPVQAVAIVYFAGLLFLPVSHYPAMQSHFAGTTALSPYWIITTALPSDALISKAWIASVAALTGALLFDGRSLLRFRPTLVDVPMLGWCLWPVVQTIFVDASPVGWQSSLYLTGVWAIPWFLGRAYYRDREGQCVLIDILIGLTLLLVPFALIEGMSGLRLYELLYGAHPFAAVGAERYIGYRPLMMFEDGNQYGLWMASMAVLAIWRYRSTPVEGGKRTRVWPAIILFLLAMASQSIGAIFLMLVGIAALYFSQFLRHLRKIAIPGLVLLLLGATVYVSGVIPLRSLAKETAVGQTALSVLRTSGRSSLSWRISQDEKTIPVIRENLVAGSGQWDWWTELGRRPWGLPLLLAGQFGLIGLLLALGSPIAAILSRWFGQPEETSISEKEGATLPPTFAISTVVIIAATDALLNAFILLPALVLAASLVVRRKVSEN
ncbi:hypothetical protein [Sphingorhabdus sp. Alg231-15]|uniref:hypothetical protein n=1 Tax=Sphingorhabdus sp. Alg231-15 TaxID=1922222 RepID=UPI000D551D3F